MENENIAVLPSSQKPKRTRRKFDHPLTEEEKKENQKMYWRKWYNSRGKHNEEFMEKRRENARKQLEYAREGRKLLKEKEGQEIKKE